MNEVSANFSSTAVYCDFVFCSGRPVDALMAKRQINAFIILTLCCIELPSSWQISSSDYISNLNDYYSVSESDVEVNDMPQNPLRLMKSKLTVDCNNVSMKVILPPGPMEQVQILDFSVTQSVLEAPESCGYSLTQGQGYNILLVDYTGCHVNLENGLYTLQVLYPDEAGNMNVGTVFCDATESLNALQELDLQSDQVPACAKVPPATAADPVLGPQQNIIPLNSKPGGCGVSADKRMTCSSSENTSDQCLAKGCCFDGTTSTCHYPMDVCTADMNFVFAVYRDFANIPINPMSLMVGGKSGCKPVISNKDFAIFKFSVNECGTRSFVIGETTIYLAEVQTVIRVRNLKYGMISRDNPIRLLIECRYSNVFATPVMARPVLASAGYMVMSQSLPPYLVSEGLFGVQLLIAEDETFTKFYPQCHQPLNVLLGKTVYLELRLKSPKPEATLVVHYCVAYPRSGRSALVLLFEGCPNPLDPGNTAVLYVKDLPQQKYKRRFKTDAFQFMDLSNNKYLNEEIYFMCSTEVCMPYGSPCVETCFDGKSS